MPYMLVLDIDYRSQRVAHALQVRDLHSMVGRGVVVVHVRALLGLGFLSWLRLGKHVQGLVARDFRRARHAC